MIKLILSLAVAVVALITLSSCSTVQGIGKDLENLGNSVQKSANN